MPFHIWKETIATKKIWSQHSFIKTIKFKKKLFYWSNEIWNENSKVYKISLAIFNLIYPIYDKLHFLIQTIYQHRYRKRWNGLRNSAGQACDRHAQNCVLSSWFYVRCLLFAFPLPSDFILSLKYCERFPYDIQCKI